MINVEDISFGYNAQKQVLQKISFNLEKGETLALVGASGCGKSTLLRILSGILPNTNENILSGKIEIDEQNPDEYRQTGKLSFMFQEASLMPNLTVKQNIELPLKIKGSNNEQKIKNLIRTVGLEEYKNFLPKQISGGMKTRVALSRAFVNEPELLLLDEPFSALDIGWKNNLYMELTLLAEEFHTSLVIVTHDVQEAILLADKIIVLNKLGGIQAHFSVNAMHISERLKNIGEFVTSNVFTDLFSPIQQAIILEDKRSKFKREELKAVLERVIISAGDENREMQIDDYFLDPIRFYANTEEVHNILTDAFSKAITLRFKYLLIWDILEYEKLSDIEHAEYFKFYMNNVDEFASLSRKWYMMHSDDRFFDILTGRIMTSKGNNRKKKWIYICDLYAIRDLQKLIPFLNSIIQGEIQEVNFPIAKLAGQKVFEKIKNEKKNNIHLS